MNKLLIIITILFGLTQNGAGQTTYSTKIQAQIKQVENNLFSRVIINGKGDNILDRMKFLKVKGLSIAVVKDYKIDRKSVV